MPQRPSNPCPFPGCPKLNCQEHRRQRAKDRGYDHREWRRQRTRDRRPSAAARGYDREWRRIRAAFLTRYKWCSVCGEPATEVDHIIPLRDGGTHRRDNLQSMCKSHHSQKTSAIDGGFGNRRGGGG
ncbi:MAG: HNH endonuclease [Chloroflexi bacterium]|nr:HNH endonuclease [Chloroflexota bacterium]